MNPPHTGVLNRGVFCFGPSRTHNYFEEVEHYFPHVMLWGVMNSEHLFGTYCFDGSVSDPNYSAMLENWFIPQLQSFGIESNV